MIAILDARPGKADQFREKITVLVREVRREPGCITFTAYQARDTEGRFYLYEVYADGAAFNAHLPTEHVHRFIAAIPALSTGGPGSVIQLDEIPVYWLAHRAIRLDRAAHRSCLATSPHSRVSASQVEPRGSGRGEWPPARAPALSPDTPAVVGRLLGQSVRFAERVGDSFALGHALLDLSNILAPTDAAEAADAARTAAGHLRQAGA